MEEVVASSSKAKVFSVLDAKFRFLHIKLDYESSLITTFNTPYGRYRLLILPFGIKSVFENFQKIMDRMLQCIQGARAIMDDILVCGMSDEDHDKVLRNVIDSAIQWNLGLNFEKCHIKKPLVDYVGHTVTEHGLEPNQEKEHAVGDMPMSKDKRYIRRFLAMVQYLSKLIPNMSTIDAPLRELLKKETGFHWSKPQRKRERARASKSFKKCVPALCWHGMTKTKKLQFSATPVIMHCEVYCYKRAAQLHTHQRPWPRR